MQGQGVTLYFVKSGSTMQQPLDGDNMTQGTTAGSDTDVGIYVLESSTDSDPPPPPAPPPPAGPPPPEPPRT